MVSGHSAPSSSGQCFRPQGNLFSEVLLPTSDSLARLRAASGGKLGDSNNTVRGHCLDIPDSNNRQTTKRNTSKPFEEQGIRFEERISRILEIPDKRVNGPSPRTGRQSVADRPMIYSNVIQFLVCFLFLFFCLYYVYYNVT